MNGRHGRASRPGRPAGPRGWPGGSALSSAVAAGGVMSARRRATEAVTGLMERGQLTPGQKSAQPSG